MRPPAQRNFVGVCQQMRPKFGTDPRVDPPRKFAKAVENADNMFVKACIRGHETRMAPMHLAQRVIARGDYYHGNRFVPGLAARPNLKAPVLVKSEEIKS